MTFLEYFRISQVQFFSRLYNFAQHSCVMLIPIFGTHLYHIPPDSYRVWILTTLPVHHKGHAVFEMMSVEIFVTLLIGFEDGWCGRSPGHFHCKFNRLQYQFYHYILSMNVNYSALFTQTFPITMA